MAEMTVELVAVERELWAGKASYVVAQTTEGVIGILPGHEPVLGQLVEGGIVQITTTDGEHLGAAVHGGFLAVTGDRVSVLAEGAELGDEVDVAAAKAALNHDDEAERAKAEARLRAAGQSV